ncbi:MAG: type I pullulanase, partial [Clostridiales bacterium]|nr:type I pullulanase [Clostridiales bacterium]
MKRIGKKSTAIFRSAVIAILIAALAVLAAPLGKLTRARAENSEPTVEADVQSGSNEGIALTAANDPVGKFTLRIVYYRPDGNYTGWNMWIWGAGSGGDYTENSSSSKGIFTNETPLLGKNCAWLEIDIENAAPDGDNIVGLIVRKSEGTNWWAAQSSNMYVSLDKIVVGDVTTICIVQDIDKVYYDLNEALTDKITSAVFTETEGVTSVEIKTNGAITSKSKFEIHDGDGNVKGTLDCSSNGKYNNTLAAVIPFTGDVDFGVEYTVVDAGKVFTETSVLKHKLYDTQSFINKYSYDGTLGVTYSAESSTFAVWTPVASDVKLNIYASDTAGTPDVYDMTRGNNGEWTATVNDDLNGKYYTYSATVNGKVNEVVDPYARSGGKNGKRGMILDLDATDPTGWATQQNPTLGSYSQAVIYEAQLRDLTIHESSNISAANRGKFLGLTEKGTDGKKTPLDYIAELGVTTVHFQPLFDFASVDESFSTATYNTEGQYNWGYDPLNYNMPEGSYSSDPSDGATRVSEMKEMVMALHNNGIQIVMDVVYNHVSNASDSNFEALMPGYYFRLSDSGAYLNGSGCGNETASERVMFRKFMIDSVKYWTEEYNIDGFRFDLMALHDVKTMNDLYDAVQELNPDVIIYGEGWDAGSNGLPSASQATQSNADKMPNIGVFNDIIRDGLKGSVFSMADTGFVSGKYADAAVYVGAAGSTSVLSAPDYKTLGNDKAYFAINPTQSVNYVSAHDNSALWDKLNASVNADKNTIKAMNRLAAASVLTSQGVSFFLAGEE